MKVPLEDSSFCQVAKQTKGTNKKNQTSTSLPASRPGLPEWGSALLLLSA